MKSKKQALVPRLRFPGFREAGEWDNFPLSKISERVTDKVGSRKLPTVSITAGHGFVSQTEKFGRDISGQQYKNYIHLKKGQFSYNKGNSKRFPQGCIYQLTQFEQVAAPNAFISFKFNSDFVPEFFKGYFDSNFHGYQLLRFITSGARSDGLLNISPDDFFSIKLPTPKKRDEQQKIADCLSSLDALIAAQADKIDALKAHKKGLMQQLFPREGETAPRLRFPEFRDAGEWKEKKLGSLIEEYREKTTKQDEFEVLTSAREGLVRQRDYYDNSRITERNNVGFNIIPPCYITYRSRSDDSRFFFNENNLGITGIISTYYPVFRMLDGSNKFFVELLSQYSRKIGKHSVGTSQTVLSINELGKIELPIPKKEEQKRIADCLLPLDALIAAHTEKLDALKAHKKGLMQQLFPSPDAVGV